MAPLSQSRLWHVMGINFSWVRIKKKKSTFSPAVRNHGPPKARLQALLCAHTPAAVWNRAGDSTESHEWMYQRWAIQSVQVNTVWWFLYSSGY